MTAVLIILTNFLVYHKHKQYV